MEMAGRAAGGAGGGSGGAALPGFVSTTVLTSSDGLFGDNVEEQRIADAPAAPRPEDAADYRPLYERLQELKERKDSEWREKNNPFAPPKALDDEEISFLRDLEERQAESQQRRKEQHDEDRAGFLLAKQQATVVSAGGASSSSGSKSSAAATSGVPVLSSALSEEARQKLVAQQSKKAPVVVRAKRKAVPAKDKAAAAKKKQQKEPSVGSKDAASLGDVASQEKKLTPPPSLGLVAYDSDSD